MMGGVEGSILCITVLYPHPDPILLYQGGIGRKEGMHLRPQCHHLASAVVLQSDLCCQSQPQRLKSV